MEINVPNVQVYAIHANPKLFALHVLQDILYQDRLLLVFVLLVNLHVLLAKVCRIIVLHALMDTIKLVGNVKAIIMSNFSLP